MTLFCVRVITQIEQRKGNKTRDSEMSCLCEFPETSWFQRTRSQQVIERKGVICMLRPSIFGESLFDEFFDFPAFPDLSEFEKMENQMNKKLYGRHAKNMMKVDIKDREDSYEMDMDLPGFKKEEISASLEDGCLTITAAKGLDQDEQEKDTGRYIRRERYAGACQRSFYVGEDIKQEDIKAEFKHGVLKLLIPKETPKVEQKNNRYIAIEG